MPRKPRITAVPVEQEDSNNEGLQIAIDVPEEKTDAEQMTEVIKEAQEEAHEAVSDAVVEVKPKAKRASRAKPKEEPKEEPPEEPQEEPQEEQKAESPLGVPGTKGEEKVACSDCGKQMSAKTLKYSHGPNCSSKKKQTNTDETQPSIQREVITDELIEHHIRTRARAERATRREAMINKLVQTAF